MLMARGVQGNGSEYLSTKDRAAYSEQARDQVLFFDTVPLLVPLHVLS